MESKVLIEELSAEDAQRFISLNVQLSEESHFLLPTVKEAHLSLQRQLELLDGLRKSGGNIFVAKKLNELVGYVGITRGALHRNEHVCQFAIGVLNTFQNQGIALNLIRRMESWALTNNILRIELSVITSNIPAISLYRKCGFNLEGIKVGSIRLEDKLVDEFLMGKNL